MKSFQDYLSESEQWSHTPQTGDELDLEVAPDELVECVVLESSEDSVTVEVDENIMGLLESRGLLRERIARYGPVGSTRAVGFTLEDSDVDPNTHPQTKDYQEGGNEEDSDEEEIDEDYMSRMMELAGIKRMAEDQPVTTYDNAAHSDPLAAKAAALAPVGTMNDPTTATTVDEGVMSEIDIDLHNIARTEDFDMLYDAFNGGMGQATQSYLENMFAKVAQHNRLHPDDQQEDILEIMMDQIVDDFGDGDIDPQEMSEAEYQGRKVPLGKPMRGDVKKFKVYVKDPKTGNVKKVNFGHGGTSAKRAGQKTMKIKKSNPARRRNFRARHRCATAKDRTTARYWSCRMW